MVADVGITVLFFGIGRIVLPGPAIIVIPAALGILATEGVWARSAYHRIRDHIQRLNNNNKEKAP